MSLLMDALRRAEEEKRRAAERAAAEGQAAEAAVVGADAAGQTTGSGTLPDALGNHDSPSGGQPARMGTEELSLEPLPPAEGDETPVVSPAAPLDEDLDVPEASAPGSSTIERALAALGLADSSGEQRDPEATRESVKPRESAGEATLPSERALRSSLREFFDTSQSVEARGSLEGTSPTVVREGGTGPNRAAAEAREAAPQAVDHRTGRSERVSAQAVLTAAHRSSSSRVFTLLVVGLFLVATALGAVGFYYYAQTLPSPQLTVPTRAVAEIEPPLPPEALRPAASATGALVAEGAGEQSDGEMAPAATVDTGGDAGAGTAAASDAAIADGSPASAASSDATDARSGGDAGTPAGTDGPLATAVAEGATSPAVPRSSDENTGTTPLAGMADALSGVPAAGQGATDAASRSVATSPPAADGAAALAGDTPPAATVANTEAGRTAAPGPAPSGASTAATAVPSAPPAAAVRTDAPILMGPEGAPPIAAAVRISRSRKEPTLAPGLMDAYAAWRKGDLPGAELGYRKVLAAQPGLRDALLGLAGVAVARGDARAAAGLYREVLERDPRDSIASAGLLLLQGGEGPAFDVAGLELMLDEEPAAAHLHFALGNHHARGQRWREAQAAYFEAWRLDVDNADYAFNLAVALDQLGQGPAASEYYRRALSNAARSGLSPTFDRVAVESRLRSLQAAATP